MAFPALEFYPTEADSAQNRTMFERDSLMLALELDAWATDHAFSIRAGSIRHEAAAFGVTALHSAAIKGDADVVNWLLEQGAEIDKRDRRGQTALHHAAQHGHLESVERLLQGQAQMDARNHSNETPLHLAAQHGQGHIVAFLLEYGADPRTVNHAALTPYDEANRSGHLEIASLLQHRMLGQ